MQNSIMKLVSNISFLHFKIAIAVKGQIIYLSFVSSTPFFFFLQFQFPYFNQRALLGEVEKENNIKNNDYVSLHIWSQCNMVLLFPSTFSLFTNYSSTEKNYMFLFQYSFWLNPVVSFSFESF